MPWREHTRYSQPKLKDETVASLYHQMVSNGAKMIVSGYGDGPSDDTVDVAVVVLDLRAREKEIFDALDALSEYVLTARESLAEFYRNADMEESPDM